MLQKVSQEEDDKNEKKAVETLVTRMTNGVSCHVSLHSASCRRSLSTDHTIKPPTSSIEDYSGLGDSTPSISSTASSGEPESSTSEAREETRIWRTSPRRRVWIIAW